MVGAGRGGRHGGSVFGSSSSSQTEAESFRHFSGGRGLRLRFRRSSTESAAGPRRGDRLLLGFTTAAGRSRLGGLCRSWCRQKVVLIVIG